MTKVPAERVHRTRHETEIAAPAAIVYGLIADAPRWPLVFPPNVHVERLASNGAHERLRMWATANGTVKSWTSRRRLDPAGRRVDFRQEVSAAPLTGMGGSWIVEERGAHACRLVLLHDFTVGGDRAEDVAWVERATDTNSRAELSRVGELARRWPGLAARTLSFEDSVRIAGPAAAVYAVLRDAAAWPRLLAHVDRVEVSEDSPGVQVMSMDTRTAAGTVHTTESVRVCFDDALRIVHKQTSTPALTDARTGAWILVPDATGVTVTARHEVILREEDVEPVLGPGATVADARRHVREELGRATTATLTLARRHAERARVRR
ncbi:aromatase/cyclase [Streptomyces sp. NPDC055952]|uniref:aromatase/cyclase n=1 Tax=Streptomyces sp. NPDC055952 TaxID=3345663 RepID=UPI0035E205C4